jgi:two-component system, chemotaxis family, protein-glutamate methylesterase/glutaminase
MPSGIEDAMSATHLVAVGASAGGVESLRRLVAKLPPDLPAAVAVVLHLSPASPSLLSQILARSGPLQVSQAKDGEVVRESHIYVAPPDHHLLVDGDRFRLDRGPTINGVRPAVDALFRSAAASYGPCAIGVVLSGSLDDGTAGLRAIKEQGGHALVQDPTDAPHRDMPSSALEHVEVDGVASASELPDHLMALLRSDACADSRWKASEHGAGDAVAGEVRPLVLSCPDCGGPLAEVSNGPELRFTCHVEHEWTELAFEEVQGRALESALYVALRIVDERSELIRRLIRRASGSPTTERLWMARLDELDVQAQLLRTALRRGVEHEDEAGPDTEPAAARAVGP